MVDGLHRRSLGRRTPISGVDRDRSIYPRVPQARSRCAYVGIGGGRMLGTGGRVGGCRAIRTRSLTGRTRLMAESVEYLVTGAGGGIGSVSRSVVELPIRDGATVRAMVHREDDRADAVRALGAQV